MAGSGWTCRSWMPQPAEDRPAAGHPEVPAFNIKLSLADKDGGLLSRYRRTVGVVQAELLKPSKPRRSDCATDPAHSGSKTSRITRL